MSGRFFRRRALAALCLRQIFLGGHPCVFFENMAEIGGVLEADALRDLEYLQIPSSRSWRAYSIFFPAIVSMTVRPVF